MISPLFTSLERLRAAANVASIASAPSTSFDADLLSCGMAASAMMQGYMSRGIRIESRAESKWATPSGVTFLKSFPVISIASVQVADGLGGWRTLTTSEFWLCDDNEVHLNISLKPRTPLQFVYTGGIGAGKARYSVSASSIVGAVGTGNVASLGGMVGKIVSWSDKGLVAVIETTSGEVPQGATVTGSGFSFVVVDSAQEVDLSSARDLQKACEQQVVYMYQRRNSLGRTGTTMGGTTTFEADYDLLPGVKRILDLYDPQLVI